MEPYWNPYVEYQAIDRIHRIGQKKAVKVHKIVISGTVEDRILALQEKVRFRWEFCWRQKREIVEGALTEGAYKIDKDLTQDDVLYLFGVGGG